MRIIEALSTRTHSLDLAPTGTGKSLAALSAAAWRSIKFGDRTIISSHNLALLDQYVLKDAVPVIAAAGEHGASLKVASLKGVGNYIDPRRTLATVSLLLGGGVLERPVDVQRLSELIEGASFPADALGDLASLTGGDDLDEVRLRELLVWALGILDDDDEIGDRQSCPVQITDREWATVSSPSSEAAIDEDEGLGFLPKSVLAKQIASEADIVVTNHVLLAIQAANGIAVVNGSTKIGDFDHIIVDEAHMLPSQVRAQGAAEVSGGVIFRLGRAVTNASDGSGRVRTWRMAGEELAEELERTLAGHYSSKGSRGGGAVALGEGDDPLWELRESIEAWTNAAKGLLDTNGKRQSHDAMLKANRALETCSRLLGTLQRTSEHRVGVARWVEQPRRDVRSNRRSWHTLAVSPVAVGGAIHRHLWHRQVPQDGSTRGVPQDLLWQLDTNQGPITLAPLGVACLSATIPNGFSYDAGLRSELVEHPSPFEKAYANSTLYVGAVRDEHLDQVADPGNRGRWKFDTRNKYPAWARQQAAALVRANGGRALVLTAKSDDGRRMAEHLREVLDVPVLSQWDGESIARVKSKWMELEESVLVGTKSLMTGVDAPGETCSLVIVDRPPRAAGNPADDARVEALMEHYDMDRWAADRLVYVADAATELQQAAGRLIRSESDSGMVAVLEPRLLRGGGMSYQEPTRLAYLKSVAAFDNKIMFLDQATSWLEERRARLGG